MLCHVVYADLQVKLPLQASAQQGQIMDLVSKSGKIKLKVLLICVGIMSQLRVTIERKDGW